ncbi:hypothetical protein AURDEDRAFT_112881 [Auricularia subglabra TFB-10046 SS5]|nr:hypothetical protein AURDEDRAFT_112881 [Auricularia subglabra TFB-10046 SS5]
MARGHEGLVDLASNVTSLLRDVKKPGVCPTCAAMTAQLLLPPGELSSPLLEDLRDNHPEFWDASIAFLTARRGEDELPALRTRLLANARNCPRRALHSQLPAAARRDDPLHALVDGLYRALCGCLTRGQRPMLVAGRPFARKGFGTRRGRWPATADELFPHAEEQCAEMHAFWLGLRLSAAPLAFLNAVVMVARTKVLPHFSAGRTQARVLYALTQALRGDLTAVPEGWAGAPPVREPTLPPASPRDREAMRAPAVGFLQTLVIGPDGTRHDHDALFAGHERAVFFAILAALRADAALATNRPAVLRLAEELFNKLDLPPSVCADVITLIPVPAPERAENVARVVLVHLRQLTRQRGCSSPGCGRTIHDNGGRPFPTCARCKTVRYCSRECQQRDWTTGQNRHKAICPLLVRLFAATELTMEIPDFQQAFERVLPDETTERTPLFEWAMSVGLVDPVLD